MVSRCDCCGAEIMPYHGSWLARGYPMDPDAPVLRLCGECDGPGNPDVRGALAQLVEALRWKLDWLRWRWSRAGRFVTRWERAGDHD